MPSTTTTTSLVIVDTLAGAVKLRAPKPPVQKCCTDILLEIFRQCLKMTSDDHFLDLTSPPWSLSYVCRQWRSLVVHSPFLWTDLHYEYFTRGRATFFAPGMQVEFAGEARNTASYYQSRLHRESRLVRLLEIFLHRSADAPLSIRIDFRLPTEAFHLLLTQCRRWEHVTFGGPLNDHILDALEETAVKGDFCNLTSATFTHGWHTNSSKPFKALQHAPRLRVASLLMLWPDNLYLPWHQLTHVTYSSPFFRNGFAKWSLELVTNLQHLVILTPSSATRYNFAPVTPPVRYELSLPLPPLNTHSTLEDFIRPSLKKISFMVDEHDVEYAKQVERELDSFTTVVHISGL